MGFEITAGSVVFSRAGRDKGRCFAVLTVEGDYALIADGSLRKAAKPKRKKLMHLRATPRKVPLENPVQDFRLRAALAEHSQKSAGETNAQG